LPYGKGCVAQCEPFSQPETFTPRQGIYPCDKPFPYFSIQADTLSGSPANIVRDQPVYAADIISFMISLFP
jgi:hypothetical protein